MGRGRLAAGTSNKVIMKSISKQEKKDLKTLASDFRLLDRKDVQEIITNCGSYAEGRRAIMRVYMAVYMK